MNTSSRTLPLWLIALIATVIGLVINEIVAAIARPFSPELMQLTPGPVGLWTVLGVVGATLVYAFMRRKQADLGRRFVRVATIVLLLSFIPDVLIYFVEIPGFTGGTIAGVIALMLLHVTTAVIAVPLLLKFAARTR